MKKVFLHGELGSKFGKEWSLEVDSPSEAVSALFANNKEIEKYLNKKEKEGIFYGIKKSPNDIFLKKEDCNLITKRDIHVFPIPQGSAFAGSLVMTGITTAASAYISNKMSQATEREEGTLSTQTQSFIFNGGENRAQQGSSVPLGYGRMKVGSNLVSDCIVNYDYDAEKGRVINFEQGIYSLVPSYSEKYYNPEAGSLLSSLAYNFFDGKSKFNTSDPAFNFLKKTLPNTIFGSNDGAYGGFTPSEIQRQRLTTIRKEGNLFAGYYYYEYNWLKGVDISKLGVVGQDGNWTTLTKGSASANSLYKVSQSDASTSSYACIQSIPKFDDDFNSEKEFYPISFAPDGELEYIAGKDKANGYGYFPISIGQRWRDGVKEKGVGWLKLESASIYKAIDLICEGPIDGFSNKDGEKLEFNKDSETIDDPKDPKFSRNPSDDYLQGVLLEDSQVKEVNPNTNQDTYNINEFDIDVAQNHQGSIGSENQSLLEPQYLFTANTKEINEKLYGPRSTSINNVVENINDLKPFEKNKNYEFGQYITNAAGSEKYIYRIGSSLNNEFKDNGDYEYSQSQAEIVYIKNGNILNFYEATNSINDFEYFNPNNTPYQQGDKVKHQKHDGGVGYYKMGSDAGDILGEFNEKSSYIGQVGKILSSNSATYKITSDYTAGSSKTITDFTVLLEADNNGSTVTTDIFYILKNTSDTSVSSRSWYSEENINPGTAQTLWQSIDISGVKDIKNGKTGPGTEGEQRQDLIDIIFSLIGMNNEGVIKSYEEENYSSHTVINPLVEELHVTLRISELSYIYEGDSLDVTYEVGELWSWLIAYYQGYHGYYLAKHGIEAVDFAIMASAAQVPQLAKGASSVAVQEAKAAAFEGAMLAAYSILQAQIDVGDKWKIGNKIENAGEIWPNKAKFRIKYGNEGEPEYSTDVYIYGVATSEYQKDIKIYLPPNPSRKDRVIKVYKLNRERNPVKEGEQAARYMEDFSLAGVTEITPVQMNYPNSVVVGTRINARDVDSIPTRNYHLRLKKVAVPSNYNPETRQYDGNWDGRFKGQGSKDDPVPESKKLWTDNPAWCLYDLISNKRYGVGKFGIKPENIDRWTLYKIAKYCDEFIPTGYSPKYKKRNFETFGDRKIKVMGVGPADIIKEFAYVNKKIAIYYDDGTCESIKITSFSESGNTVSLERNPVKELGECATEIDYPLVEPRYTINALLMNAQNAFKLINEFASIFRAYSYWSGGSINFFQDEKKESIMLFANNNISKEGFSYSGTPKTSRTNACKIKYLDKYNMFKPKVEYSQDNKSIRENQIIEQTIDGFGVTSQSQAKRAADFIIKTANMESEVLSFTTSSIGSYLKPGDIIDVLDNKRTIGRFAGKIVDVDLGTRGRVAELSVDYPVRTIIDPDNKDTWKNIKLYNISGNQTIESLDQLGSVEDEDIDNMRLTQIKDFPVYQISENYTKLTVLNNPYKLITGEYTWEEAYDDAKERGGSLANILNEQDQIMVQQVAPKDSNSWIGGYLSELPPPEKFVWHEPKGCDGDEIKFSSWAEGYPGAERKIETDDLDSSEELVTDYICSSGILNIVAEREFSGENFISVSGSNDKAVHADWVTQNGETKLGYIIEEPLDDSLFKLRDIKGTTFLLEDSVNLAKPRQYKIINITESSNGVYKMQGIEYSKEKFDNIERDLSIKAPESPVIFTENSIDPPSEIKVEILPEDISASIPYGIKATWEMVNAAASYKVQFFNENILLSTFEIPNNKSLEEISHIYRSERIVENGNYYVRVYSIAR